MNKQSQNQKVVATNEYDVQIAELQEKMEKVRSESEEKLEEIKAKNKREIEQYKIEAEKELEWERLQVKRYELQVRQEESKEARKTKMWESIGIAVITMGLSVIGGYSIKSGKEVQLAELERE